MTDEIERTRSVMQARVEREKRTAVIEECARIVDGWSYCSTKTFVNPARDIAAAIRALKDKP